METNLQALDLDKMSATTQNVYKTVAILGKRANQIAAKTKAELNEKLSEFISYSDSMEEVVENREQIELAKVYEAMPKPTLLSIYEMNQGEVAYSEEIPE